MKPTKEQLFALYFGQEVVVIAPEFGNVTVNVCSTVMRGLSTPSLTCYLTLRKLESITAEEVYEIGDNEFNMSDPLYVKAMLISSTNFIPVHLADKIRSKGFALPFLGMSVEDQVKEGWIKLLEP